MIHRIHTHGFGFSAEQLDLGCLVPSVTILVGEETVTLSPAKDPTVRTDVRPADTFLGKGVRSFFRTETPKHRFDWSVTATDHGLIFGAVYTNKTDAPVHLQGFDVISHADAHIRCFGDPADWIVDATASITDQPVTTYAMMTERYNAWGIPLDLSPNERNNDCRWRDFRHEFNTLYSRTAPDGLYIAPVGNPVAYLNASVFVDTDSIGGFCHLEEHVDMCYVIVKPGQSRASQDILFGYGPWESLSRKVFEHLAQTHGSRTQKKPPVGWCSWYDLAYNITQESILSTAEGAKKLASRLPMDVIQIDDGYQRGRGDWECNDDPKKFPDGFGVLIDAIHDAGARAGIWLAPTNVEGSVPAFEALGDAIWETRGGGISKDSPDWLKKTYHLDITHPDGMAFAVNCLREKKALGFTYFKLDFLMVPVDGRISHDGTKTELEAARELYKNCREAIGEESYLCATASGSRKRCQFGYMDSCRTGTDSCAVWLNPHYSSCDIANCIWDLNDAQMANGIIFAVDPDVTYVNWNLSDEELHTWTSYVGLIGGTQMISDALGKDITAQNFRRFEILAPASADIGTPVRGEVDLWKRRFGFNAIRPWGCAGVYSVVNPEDETALINTALNQRLDALGDRFHVWSFWDGEYLGIRGADFAITLGVHANRLMRFTPVSDGVQFIGSDLHISTGSTEITDVRVADTEAEIVLRADAGARCGSLYLYSETAPTALSFEGMADASYTYADNLICITLTDRARAGTQSVKVVF